jgi:hypothetical protein
LTSSRAACVLPRLRLHGVTFASNHRPREPSDQPPAMTAGRSVIARCTMSLTELLLLVMGTIIFAVALSLAIGIASHVITVG